MERRRTSDVTFDPQYFFTLCQVPHRNQINEEIYSASIQTTTTDLLLFVFFVSLRHEAVHVGWKNIP